jgi:hypothetical protein
MISSLTLKTNTFERLITSHFCSFPRNLWENLLECYFPEEYLCGNIGKTSSLTSTPSGMAVGVYE